MRTNRPAPRRGFTLLEMLIVALILLILLGLVAGVTSKMQEGKKTAQGINLVQSALMIAKQRAKRDRMPTGIRLITSSTPTLPAGGPYVQQILLVQQPDDFTGYGSGGTLQASGGNPAQLSANVSVSFSGGGSFTGGFKSQSQYLVQPGDFLEVNGGGHVHLISSVSRKSLTLAIAPDATCYLNGSTQNFRIIRRARVLIGEQPVNLNQDLGIDLGYSYNVPTDSMTGNMDIMFSPGGGLMNQNFGNFTGSSSIYLYVRDLSYGSNFLQGQPAIVSVHSRSGLISTHPPATPPLSLYQYCEDGMADGM